jgi:hypothetical protein
MTDAQLFGVFAFLTACFGALFHGYGRWSSPRRVLAWAVTCSLILITFGVMGSDSACTATEIVRNPRLHGRLCGGYGHQPLQLHALWDGRVSVNVNATDGAAETLRVIEQLISLTIRELTVANRSVPL